MNLSHTHRADPGVVKQRVTSLADGGIGKPAGAANSVFDVAKSRRAPKVPVPAIDLATLIVRKGVPIPESQRRSEGSSRYQAVLARLEPGDSVVLLARQAHSLVSYAKKHEIKVAVRKFGDGTTGVWRL